MFSLPSQFARLHSAKNRNAVFLSGDADIHEFTNCCRLFVFWNHTWRCLDHPMILIYGNPQKDPDKPETDQQCQPEPHGMNHESTGEEKEQ